MIDIYELLNDINMEDNDFVEMEVDEVERKRVKKALKASIRKKIIYKKRRVMVASLALIIPIFFGVTLQAYGEKIPFLGDIFKHLNKRVEPIYENYMDYATPINITKESNGIKITINEAIFDGTTLNYTYTIESDRDLGERPVIGASSDPINIDGEYEGGAGGGSIERIEGNTYVGHDNFTFHELDEKMKGYIKLNIDWKDIAIVDGNFWRSSSANGEVELGGDIIEIIEGSWNFDIELKSIENKEIIINKGVKKDGLEVNIDTISITPVATKLEYTEKVDRKRIDNWVFNYFIVEMEDNLGNKYVSEGNGGYGDSISITSSSTFNKINKNATKIIIKVKAVGEELLDGVWNDNRKVVEKDFEPIIIDIKNDWK